MSKATVLNLRLTADEKADWQRQADESGISLAELVRRRMNGGGPQPPAAVPRPQDYPKPPTRPGTRAAAPPPSRKAVPSPTVPDFTKGKS